MLTVNFRPTSGVANLVLCLLPTLAYLDISGERGPQHGPGGNGNHQKPPEHPHDR